MTDQFLRYSRFSNDLGVNMRLLVFKTRKLRRKINLNGAQTWYLMSIGDDRSFKIEEFNLQNPFV